MTGNSNIQLGQQLFAKVLECNSVTQRLIFSERAALSKPGARNELLANLRPGLILTGKITTLTNFGVFVDLGGVEGLLHLSEISWGRVHNLNEMFRTGQLVRVMVLHYEPNAQKIGLSIKRITQNPWVGVEYRYQPEMVLDGEVAAIYEYGVFVLFEDGLEGLIHVSELAAGNFIHPANVVRLRQRVRVQVLSVSQKNQRVALRLLETLQTPSE